MKKALSLLMVLCLVVLTVGLSVKVNAADPNAADPSETFDLTKTDNYTLSSDSTKATWNGTYVAFELSKGTSNGITGGLTNGHKRFYANTIITFTPASGYKIKSIVVTCTSTSYATALKDSTWSNGTATVSGSTVTILASGTSTVSAKMGAQARATSIVVEYVSLSEKSISITSGATKIKAGDTSTYVAETTGFESGTAVTWTSSNTSAATINESTGVLTALALGTTKITASIGDVVSNEYSVFVYPDNTNPISIELALQIAETYGTTESDLNYKSLGTIKEITDTKNFVITDGTNDITVYNVDHGLTDANIGNKVLVEGKIKTYKSNNVSTEEYVLSTLTNYYTVTLNADNGTANTIINDVLSGSVIEAPTAPTKADYTFLGWYNGTVLWDFANDTVTSDITLTAKWISNSLVTLAENLNAVSAYMSMGYKYSTSLGAIVKDTITADKLEATGNSYTNFTGKTFTSSAEYSGNSALNNNTNIQLRATNPSGIVTTASGGKAKKVIIVWGSGNSSGRTIDVYGKNTAYESAADLYGDTKGTKIGSIKLGEATELSISGDYSYIGIRSNSGALYATSISIEWDGSSYNDVDFRIRCGIDSSISNAVDGLTGATYGIEVSDGTTSKKYLSTNTTLYKKDTTNDIDYVVISLGDVLNNKDRLDTEFTVRAFVEYEGQTYYSTATKTYSVVTLVNEYLKDTAVASQIEGFKNILEGFGKTFE